MNVPVAGRSPLWVGVTIGAVVLGVVHAAGSLLAVAAGPDLITVSSLLFVVFWYWIAVGAWRHSADGRGPSLGADDPRAPNRATDPAARSDTR